MKRIVSIDMTRQYVFDDAQFPMDKYDDDTIMDIAYGWFSKCTPDLFIETIDDDD